MIIHIFVYEEGPTFALPGYTKINAYELGIPYAIQLYESYTEVLEIPDWLGATTAWVVRQEIQKDGFPLYGFQLWIDVHKDYNVLLKLMMTETQRLENRAKTYSKWLASGVSDTPKPRRSYRNLQITKLNK